jgi:hypothetical protein
VTQERVKALFQQLGYTFQGDWTDRNHWPIDEALLRAWLILRFLRSLGHHDRRNTRLTNGQPA